MSERDERVEALARDIWNDFEGSPFVYISMRDSESIARSVLDSPAMRDLLAEAWDEGWAGRAEYDHRRDVPTDWPDLNPYRDDHREGCGSCLACDPPRRGVSGLPIMRMYVCATCGNKRCPAAGDCQKWECSGSNDTGQTPVPRHPSVEQPTGAPRERRADEEAR